MIAHQMIHDPPAVPQQHRIDGELNTRRENSIFLTVYHFFHGSVVLVTQASFHETQSYCVDLAKTDLPGEQLHRSFPACSTHRIPTVFSRILDPNCNSPLRRFLTSPAQSAFCTTKWYSPTAFSGHLLAEFILLHHQRHHDVSKQTNLNFSHK